MKLFSGADPGFLVGGTAIEEETGSTMAKDLVNFLTFMKLKKIWSDSHRFQWRIQDFSEEGALTPKGGAPTYYLANFSQKLRENEEILGRGGRASLAPPLRSPTGFATDFQYLAQMKWILWVTE